MRAVRLHGIGDLRFESDITIRELLPDHVRVRVRAAGVCGSDLHNYRTGQWLSRAPTIPGHEFAGEVLAVGSRLQGSPHVAGLRPGQRVIGDSRVNCGVCAPCREGRPNLCGALGYVGEVCDGAFAEWIDLPPQRLLPVPDGVSLRVAALAEPLGVALHVLRRLDAPRDTPVLIAGAGPIGGLAAVLLAHQGFGPLAIIERNAARAALVAEITGARTIAATRHAADEFASPRGLRFAIEATGSAQLLTLLVDALVGDGRLALVGITHGPQTVSLNSIVEKELEVRGCSVFGEEQREVLPLLKELSDKLDRLISPAVGLEELPQEYARLLDGSSPYLKTIVEP